MFENVDILKDNTELVLSYFEKGFMYFFIIVICTYLIRIFIPFIGTLLISLFVRYIANRSLNSEVNTFNHFLRYYGYTLSFISLLSAVIFFQF